MLQGKIILTISDEPDLKELSVMLEHIIEEMKEDGIKIKDIAIVAEGGEIMDKVTEVTKQGWPRAIHVQSLMGHESLVVIWVTSGNYLNRQVSLNSLVLFKYR